MLTAITEFFEEMTLFSVIARLILAAAMGSLVGMERAHKRYAAGIRTFALVCLGASLATVTSLYLTFVGSGEVDVARIPAQILCGIGFLGAGTIIVTDRKQVKGLTTAAGLWVTSAMGIAIGAGFVWAALACLVLVLITNYLMYYMTKYVENHTRTIEIYVEIERKQVESLLRLIREKGYLILSIERRKEPSIIDEDIALRIEIDMLKKYYHPQLVDDIMGMEGVHYIEEIL